MPVQADLSDLDAQARMVLQPPSETAQPIAAAGQALALQVVDEIEDDLICAGVHYAQAWM